MTTRRPEPPISIHVDPDEGLPQVLQQMREHPGQSVVLEIPEHCPVLLTATEFRTIKEAADREGITVAMRTEDRLRNQLAAMFGIKNLHEGKAARAGDGWRPPQTMLGSPRAFGTWSQADDEDAGDDTIEPGTRTRRRRGDVIETNTNPRRAEPEEVALDYLDEPTTFWTPKNIGRIAGAVLLIGAILFAAGWYYMPAVTVQATLRQQQVTEQLLYSVAAPGATLPSDIAFTAEAELQEATVDFEITIPTTGVQRTPDQTAYGQVLLRNPGGEPVTVPAGTTLTVYAGPSYTTDVDVEVPAASDGQAGEASVGVTATEPGASGNAEAGLVTGQVPDLGVFYSNRDAAIEGGTDIEVKTVTEEDLDRLEEEVRLNLSRAAAEGWARQLPEGQSVVSPSVQTGDPTYDVTNEVGDRVDEISVQGTVDATGLVFDAATVQQQTREFFQTALQDQVPDGYALDAESVTLGTPQVIAEAPDNVQYQVEATATAHAVFADGDANRLANDLAGSSWADAEATLAGVGAFESFEMTSSPGWWPEGMPQAADRVTVNVDRGDAGDPAPTPAPSPEGEGTS